MLDDIDSESLHREDVPHRGLGDGRTALIHAVEALELLRANHQLLLEADVLTELARDHLDVGAMP